jgi:hypothetical protein
MHRLLIVLCALIPAAANALFVPATSPRIAEYMSIACEYLPEAKDCSKLENPSIQFADTGRALGLYHHRTRLIHMSNECLSRVADQTKCAGILVHELAHYILDWTTNIKGCESERIAWRVYNEYVVDQGRKDLLVDNWIERYPQCAKSQNDSTS